jgi:outer membrane protein assembly factor BamB
MLASKDILFVPSGRSMPAAIKRSNGERIYKSAPSWRRDGGGQIGGTDAMLANDQLYSLAEHHVLALDQERGRTGFGWFLARRMTMAGDMAYMANGQEIIAVDHSEHAAATRKRHPLDLKMNDLTRAITRHKAPSELKDAKSLKDKLVTARLRLEELTDRGGGATPGHATARESLKVASSAYATAAKKYEKSRQDFNTKQEQYKKLKASIEEFKQVGIKWRFNSKNESSLVVTGNSVVAGGIGEVTVLDILTGKPKWQSMIKGEARGLAIADGRLFVSTTEGEIYCFAPPAKNNSVVPLTTAVTDPFPEDALSKTYAAAAQSILEESGMTRGFCLILGAENGRLAYQLAKRSKLLIYGIDPDGAKVTAARAKLSATGLYGSRIIIDHVPTGSPVPYPNYFANLITSDTLLLNGQVPGRAQSVVRHLKPGGGVICLGMPGEPEQVLKIIKSEVVPWLASTGLIKEKQTTQTFSNGWSLLTRGRLPGTDDWSHQYGNAGNTSSNNDTRVRDGLSVLWYGDPGPEHMVNRHAGAVGPVSANGRLFIPTDHSVMAYDAYNGLFLWAVENPGAMRTGLKKAYEPGNMAASNDSLFMVEGKQCFHIDAASGEVVRTYTIPDPGDGSSNSRRWTYISHSNGILFGTSTDQRRLLKVRATKGQTAAAATDQLFAYDTKSGERLWTYQGQSVSHVSIAVGDGRIFFIDATMRPDQREAFLRQDKSEFKKLTGKARELAEERLKKQDLRLAIALKSRTGKKAWESAVDVTDCSGIGIGAGSLTLMHANGHLVLGGANANGHYWKQFLSGEFERRRLVVLSSANGEKIWAKDANYRHRPIVIGNEVVAEPWSYDLYTGTQKTRRHPLTGESTPWKFIRPGHHCGAISATPNMLFFRSRYTAYYNLETDNGTQHFAGHRTGCWINSIPANGLVMVPEASAGCVCLFSIAATVVFEPNDSRENWGVFTAEGNAQPVRHMVLNLGAPGDRRDDSGKLWLGYPRPNSRTGLDLPLNLKPVFSEGGRFSSRNASEVFDIGKKDTPPRWIYASGCSGLTHCELPLLAKDQPQENYTVRLFFAAGGDGGGIRLEDKIVRATNVTDTENGRVLEFHDIVVAGALTIDLPEATVGTTTLSGIEVLRSGAREIRQ